jgi:hypothetical protein
MRAWPKIVSALLLALPLTAMLVPTAEASTKQVVVSTRSTVTKSAGTAMRSSVRVVSIPGMSSLSSFFPLTNGVLFPTGAGFRNRFNRFGAFSQPTFGWWDSSLFGWAGPYTDQSQAPRIIVISAAPRQPPAAPPEPAKITVETTPSGVQVVRGPGSRHLYRY